mgnify:CR=1 FL=1
MTVKIQSQKIGGTAYYRFSISIALNTIVAPAANTKGIRVRYARVQAYSGVTRLMAKTSAPADVTDGVEILGAAVTGSVANIYVVLPDEKIIPPGFGLYEQSNNGAQEGIVSVDYEVLA